MGEKSFVPRLERGEDLAKQINRIAKLEFIGCEAKPGPELASLGINMPQFCVKFNEQTKDRKGEVVPVVITAYRDKSFDFILKTTPAAVLLKKAAGVEKGSGKASTDIVGKVTREQITEIAKYKMPDLNTNNIEQAIKIIAGTARNMGISVELNKEGENNHDQNTR